MIRTTIAILVATLSVAVVFSGQSGGTTDKCECKATTTLSTSGCTGTVVFGDMEKSSARCEPPPACSPITGNKCKAKIPVTIDGGAPQDLIAEVSCGGNASAALLCAGGAVSLAITCDSCKKVESQ